jgi:hypothetical protein
MHLALPWYLRVSTELLSCFIGAKVQAESYTSSFLKVGKCRLNGLGDNLSAYALRRSDFSLYAASFNCCISEYWAMYTL